MQHGQRAKALAINKYKFLTYKLAGYTFFRKGSCKNADNTAGK